jgi:hypothetical protein
MKTPNTNRDESDDDDEDDRKPPAKEIHLVKTPNKSTKEAEEGDASPEDSNGTGPTSGDISLASTASYSVGRAFPPSGNNNNNNRTPNFYTPTPKKGRAGLPSLTASTPCSPNDASVEFGKPPVLPATETITRSRAQARERNIYLWMGTVALAMAVFISQILPAAAMTTLVFLLASTGMLTQTVIQTARQWYYENVVTGNGLGRWLLPDSLYRTLTETSLHEYMTDPTFGLENRHLLLYFLPLTAEQLNDSLQRLAPQHRDRLFRPGMGHMLLGESLMRVLLGEPRYQQQRRPSRQQPAAIDIRNTATTNSSSATTIEVVDTTVASPLPRQRLLLTTTADDDDDDDESETSDLGLEVSANDLAGGLNQQQAASVARRLGLEDATATAAATPMRTTPQPPPLASRISAARTPSSAISRRLENNTSTTTTTATTANGQDDEDYADQELQVLMDAFWGSAYGSVWNPIRNYVSSAVILPSVSTVSRFWARSGMMLSFSAGGLGIWGWWAGVYTLPTLASLSTTLTSARSNARERVTYPPSWSVWTTALVGGTSIGLSLYARHYVRRSFGGNPNENGTSKKSDTKKNDE